MTTTNNGMTERQPVTAVTVAQPLQKTIQTLKNQNKYKNNLV